MSEIAKKIHNSELDFWKFICSIIIVIHHSYLIFDNAHYFFEQGSLCVEFFFIVSGFLMVSSVKRKSEPYDKKTIGSETSSFIFRKYCSVIYYFLFIVIFSIAFRVIRLGFRNGLFTSKSLRIIGDCLFLNITGIPIANIDPPMWYVSAMLIVMFIIYPLLRKNADVFVKIVAPVATVLLYGFLFATDLNVLDPLYWYGFAYKGLIRAFAGISLGCIAYDFSDKIRRKESLNKHGFVLSVVGILSMLASVLIMYKSTRDDMQPIVILLFLIFVSISGSGKSISTKLFSGKFFSYLGKLSTTIFIVHYSLIEVLNFINDKYSLFEELKKSTIGRLEYLLIFIAFSVILGIICAAVCDIIKKLHYSKKKRDTV